MLLQLWTMSEYLNLLETEVLDSLYLHLLDTFVSVNKGNHPHHRLFVTLLDVSIPQTDHTEICSESCH